MAFNTNTTGQAAKVAQAITITGTFASPIVITAAGGITPGGYSGEFMFIKSNGGQFLISANPQIAVGTSVGQTLTLIGTDDVDAIVFSEGNGVFVGNATFQPIEANCVLVLTWTGTTWANMTNSQVIDTDP